MKSIRAIRNFYVAILLAFFAGSLWLGMQSVGWFTTKGWGTACFFKNITGIPCPSCGTTRSMEALMEGHIFRALSINPLGFVLAALFIIVPSWILYDLAKGSATFYKAYGNLEKIFQKKQVYLPVIFLIIMNWIWNIYKHL